MLQGSLRRITSTSMAVRSRCSTARRSTTCTPISWARRNLPPTAIRPFNGKPATTLSDRRLSAERSRRICACLANTSMLRAAGTTTASATTRPRWAATSSPIRWECRPVLPVRFKLRFLSYNDCLASFYIRKCRVSGICSSR